MGFYGPATERRGVVMSPIASEKKRARNEPVYSFTWFDIAVVLISMGTYLADIVTDILVTLVYWKLDEKIWAGLTLAFLIAPSIIMQIFSTRWYMADGHRASVSMFLIHMLMMGPIKRYVTVLKFGLRARKTKRIEDYQAMYSELSDVSMLRLFESFLESAPQLVLQLYIMIKVTEDDHILTGIAAFFSLISLAWAIAAYTKALRTAAFSQDSRKKRVSWSGLALQTLWRVGMVAGRIVALVLCATIYPVGLLVGVGIHWFVMTIWLVAQDTDFCGTWWEEKLFNTVVGVIHIFCFFNMKEGRSRWRMIAFYLITLAENTAMILLWFPQRTVEMWYDVPALLTVWGGYIIGLASMMLYYRYFHPSSAKKCHCCMFYYHLVYKCCPCHDNTTLHGTPYKRNIGKQTFSSDSDTSSFGEYQRVSDVHIDKTDSVFDENAKSRKISHGQDIHENEHFEENLRKKNILVKYRPNSEKFFNITEDIELQSINSKNEEKPKKSLFMPKPKATSTPGDELDEKFGKKYKKLTQNDPLFEETTSDGEMTFTSPSRSSSGTLDGKIINAGVFSPDIIFSTPSVLKNLPGAENGPATNKGNSTLVREWVKKTQDIYGGTSKKGVSFDDNTEFGTLGTRHATKDEREFMEMHFGDLRDETAQPSGRRDILRLKSFSKKDRQPKQVKKRRRSSHNITDLRNNFREAFGFHTVDQEHHQVVKGDNSELKIIESQPQKITHKNTTWGETEIDEKDKQKEGKVIRHKKKINQRSTNVILARIDQPPPNYQNSIPSKNRNPRKIVNDKVSTESNDFDKVESASNQIKFVMENLHGTANPVHNVENHIINSVAFVPSTNTLRLDKDTKVIDTNEVVAAFQSNDKLIEKSRYDNLTTSDVNLEASSDNKREAIKSQGNGLLEEACSSHVASTHATDAYQNHELEGASYEQVTSTHASDAVQNQEFGGVSCDQMASTHANNALQFHKFKGDPVAPQQTASYALQTDTSEIKHLAESDRCCDIIPKQNVSSLKNDFGNISSSNDVFGPVIQIRGDKITIKHKDAVQTDEAPQKAQSISNPVHHGLMNTVNIEKLNSHFSRRQDFDSINKVENVLISNPGDSEKNMLISNPGDGQVTTKKVQNQKLTCAGTRRRDRVEYLYKLGRQGLKKTVQNSPARKRLSFKKGNTSNDDLEHFYIEESKTKRKKKDANHAQHSIEALGKSMEEVASSGENYVIHIQDQSTSRKNYQVGMKLENRKGKRRTLGAIENKI